MTAKAHTEQNAHTEPPYLKNIFRLLPKDDTSWQPRLTENRTPCLKTTHLDNQGSHKTEHTHRQAHTEPPCLKTTHLDRLLPKDDTSWQVVAQKRHILTTKAHTEQGSHRTEHTHRQTHTEPPCLKTTHLDNQGSHRTEHTHTQNPPA